MILYERLRDKNLKEDYNDLDALKMDKDAVIDSFHFNWLTILAMKSMLSSKRKTKIDQYFRSEGPTRIEKITDETNNDFLMSLKLAYDNSQIKKSTATEMTKFAYLLRSGKIKEVDESIIRNWFVSPSDVSLPKDPLLKSIRKDFVSGTSLDGIIKSLFDYFKKKSKDIPTTDVPFFIWLFKGKIVSVLQKQNVTIKENVSKPKIFPANVTGNDLLPDSFKNDPAYKASLKKSSVTVNTDTPNYKDVVSNPAKDVKSVSIAPNTDPAIIAQAIQPSFDDKTFEEMEKLLEGRALENVLEDNISLLDSEEFIAALLTSPFKISLFLKTSHKGRIPYKRFSKKFGSDILEVFKSTQSIRHKMLDQGIYSYDHLDRSDKAKGGPYSTFKAWIKTGTSMTFEVVIEDFPKKHIGSGKKFDKFFKNMILNNKVLDFNRTSFEFLNYFSERTNLFKEESLALTLSFILFNRFPKTSFELYPNLFKKLQDSYSKDSWFSDTILEFEDNTDLHNKRLKEYFEDVYEGSSNLKFNYSFFPLTMNTIAEAIETLARTGKPFKVSEALAILENKTAPEGSTKQLSILKIKKILESSLRFEKTGEFLKSTGLTDKYFKNIYDDIEANNIRGIRKLSLDYEKSSYTTSMDDFNLFLLWLEKEGKNSFLKNMDIQGLEVIADLPYFGKAIEMITEPRTYWFKYSSKDEIDAYREKLFLTMSTENKTKILKIFFNTKKAEDSILFVPLAALSSKEFLSLREDWDFGRYQSQEIDELIESFFKSPFSISQPEEAYPGSVNTLVTVLKTLIEKGKVFYFGWEAFNYVDLNEEPSQLLKQAFKPIKNKIFRKKFLKALGPIDNHKKKAKWLTSLIGVVPESMETDIKEILTSEKTPEDILEFISLAKASNTYFYNDILTEDLIVSYLEKYSQNFEKDLMSVILSVEGSTVSITPETEKAFIKIASAIVSGKDLREDGIPTSQNLKNNYLDRRHAALKLSRGIEKITDPQSFVNVFSEIMKIDNETLDPSDRIYFFKERGPLSKLFTIEDPKLKNQTMEKLASAMDLYDTQRLKTKKNSAEEVKYGKRMDKVLNLFKTTLKNSVELDSLDNMLESFKSQKVKLPFSSLAQSNQHMIIEDLKRNIGNNFGSSISMPKKTKNKTYLKYLKEIEERNSKITKMGLPNAKVEPEDISQDQLDRESIDFNLKYNAFRHANGISCRILKKYKANFSRKDLFEEYKKNNISKDIIVPGFHGTGTIGANMISRFGFLVDNKAKVGRMLGKGLYIAANVDKSLLYIADQSYSRSSGYKGFIMKGQVVLGGDEGDGGDWKSGGFSTYNKLVSPEWAIKRVARQFLVEELLFVETISGSQFKSMLTNAGMNLDTVMAGQEIWGETPFRLLDRI